MPQAQGFWLPCIIISNKAKHCFIFKMCHIDIVVYCQMTISLIGVWRGLNNSLFFNLLHFDFV